MGVGPVSWTSLPTGISECELGPCHTEWSPILSDGSYLNRGKSTLIVTVESLMRGWCLELLLLFLSSTPWQFNTI